MDYTITVFMFIVLVAFLGIRANSEKSKNVTLKMKSRYELLDFNRGYGWAMGRLKSGVIDAQFYAHIRKFRTDPNPYDEGILKAYSDWQESQENKQAAETEV